MIEGRVLLVGLAALALAGCANLRPHDDDAGPSPGSHSTSDRPQAKADPYYYDSFELYGEKADVAAFETTDCVVYFELDSATVTPDELAGLDRCARELREHEGALRLAGHADDRGSTTYNQQLGARRAQAVRDALAERGIDLASAKLESYGEQQPAVDGTSETARSKNRRVEVQQR